MSLEKIGDAFSSFGTGTVKKTKEAGGVVAKAFSSVVQRVKGADVGAKLREAGSTVKTKIGDIRDKGGIEGTFGAVTIKDGNFTCMIHAAAIKKAVTEAVTSISDRVASRAGDFHTWVDDKKMDLAIKTVPIRNRIQEKWKKIFSKSE